MQNCNDRPGDLKRLFIAFEMAAPWPETFPAGRILKEENRHMTLAFLGHVSLPSLQNQLINFPKPEAPFAFSGICEKLVFLPHNHPRVVAGHVLWFNPEMIDRYISAIKIWLEEYHYPVEKREFLSHITLARAPFHIGEWKKHFSPFPVITKAIHLYETVECLQYQSRWNLPLNPPFEEIEHTADVAFVIFGKTIQEISLHAHLALSFKFPELTHFFPKEFNADHLESLIMQLNGWISHVDAEIGCPFKAVSFHGNIITDAKGLLRWEMIVDV